MEKLPPVMISMSQPDPVTFRQIPVIQQIIRDETWLEGERRGCFVPSNDPVVRENVCQVILRIGRDLRETLLAEMAAAPGPAMIPIRISENDRAA
jgi:hypothetical protein